MTITNITFVVLSLVIIRVGYKTIGDLLIMFKHIKYFDKRK